MYTPLSHTGKATVCFVVQCFQPSWNGLGVYYRGKGGQLLSLFLFVSLSLDICEPCSLGHGCPMALHGESFDSVCIFKGKLLGYHLLSSFVEEFLYSSIVSVDILGECKRLCKLFPTFLESCDSRAVLIEPQSVVVASLS